MLLYWKKIREFIWMFATAYTNLTGRLTLINNDQKQIKLRFRIFGQNNQVNCWLYSRQIVLSSLIITLTLFSCQEASERCFWCKSVFDRILKWELESSQVIISANGLHWRRRQFKKPVINDDKLISFSEEMTEIYKTVIKGKILLHHLLLIPLELAYLKEKFFFKLWSTQIRGCFHGIDKISLNNRKWKT